MSILSKKRLCEKPKIPKQIMVWIFSSHFFLLVLFGLFVICILGSLIFNKDYSWIAIYLPILIAIIFQRYSDDMKDARECERKLEYSLNELKAYTFSAKSVLIEKYLAVIKCEFPTLQRDVEWDYNFEKVSSEFVNRLNNFNAAMNYALRSPVQVLAIRSLNVKLDFNEMNLVFQNLTRIWAIYLDVLHCTKLANNGTNKLTAQNFQTALASSSSIYHLEEQYKSDGYFEKVKMAFEYIELLKIDSIFSEDKSTDF